MPGFDINSFLANFNNGAKQYLFYIFINNPFGRLGTESTAYLVRSSSLPEGTIDVIEADWQGSKYRIGSTHTFGEWTVTFNVDVPALVHTDFEEWQRNIHDPETNTHGDPGLYLADQRIWLLDGEGNMVKEKMLVGAWPSTVGEVTLDYSAKELAQFDVTFTYQFYK